MINEGHHDIHETFALAALKDAARLLEREIVGEPDAELIRLAEQIVAVDAESERLS